MQPSFLVYANNLAGNDVLKDSEMPGRRIITAILAKF
jgi:hypothetical protein